MMARIEFVGGPLDGTMRDVTELPREILIPVPCAPPLAERRPPDTAEPWFTRLAYQRTRQLSRGGLRRYVLDRLNR